MLKRLGGALLVTVVAASVVLVARGGAATAQSPNLVVHEWGTFTSIAGVDGQAVQWRPLTGPSDLPCFVTALNPNSLKFPAGGVLGFKTTVRMETPVLYFYSPTEQTVNVTVTFPQGLISEWYPEATARPGTATSLMANPLGRIQWSGVKVTPGMKENFPTEPDGSHYYAARETDAVPLQVNGQQEKFIFYRGLANMPLPLSVRLDAEGRIAVEQGSGSGVDTFILFERRAGRIGYRVIHAGGKNVVLERPELTANIQSLRQELRTTLMGEGLYAREAAAMVETWRDSWFEDGARLFYVFPQSAVDAVLPLQIQPKPSDVKRVFIGRMEIVTPEIESEVAEAVRTNNHAVLRKYGRFLEPISQIVQSKQLAARFDQKRMDEAMKLVASQSTKTACAAPGAAGPSTPIDPRVQGRPFDSPAGALAQGRPPSKQ